MSESLQEQLNAGNALFLKKNYKEAIEKYDEILKNAAEAEETDYNEQFEKCYEETLNKVCQIAASMKYKSSSELSAIYEEYLMNQKAISFLADDSARRERIRSTFLLTSAEFTSHIKKIREEFEKPKQTSSFPLFAGISIAVVVAAFFYYKHLRN